MTMKALCIGTALALLLPSAQAATEDDATPPALSVPETPSQSAPSTPASAPPTPAVEADAKVVSSPKRADFAREQPSRDARQLADWILDSGDNTNKHFAIIDKKNAKLFVFDAEGALRGAAHVLLGAARGDHTAHGVGDKKLSAVRLQERTTPAGRFVASVGKNGRGEDVVWVDYDGAVSMHRVIKTQDRLKRIATASAKDKRVSYGCINVPAAFYDSVLSPAFTSAEGIVYVLPEIRAVGDVFAGLYDVDERSARGNAGQSAPAR
jgi:hypothetical protein